MTLARALLTSVRPRQWAKNALLLAPLVFAHRVADPSSSRRALLAVVAFSLLASAVYLGNDLADRDRDRSHPVKRERPLAAGLLPPAWAAGAALSLGAAGLALAWGLGVAFFGWSVGYLALQALYSGLLKQVAVLDVFAVAAGFVLRVVAGAAAIDVPVSNWLYLCTLLLALFLALEKRRAELVLLGAEAGRHRGILAAYSVGLLDQLTGIAAAAAVLAYSLYTLSPDTVHKFGTDRLKYTVPFVLFGIFRYLWLAHRDG
ncbi:MAG TPA: decaprenyl-phosphate phosphoribosyltransferase, partial [Anaeromyxobacteraceae bacterium]